MELQFRLLADPYRFVKLNSAVPADLSSSAQAFTVNVAGDYSIMLPAAETEHIQQLLYKHRSILCVILL